MKMILMTMMVLLTTVSYAGVAEKKAVKEGDAKIAEYTAQVKQKCGVDIKVDSKHVDAGKLKEEGRDEANMISVAGSICGEVMYALAQICGDEDYKIEIAKIKNVKCIPKKIDKSPYWVVKKDGATITVEHNPITSYYSDGIGLLKKLF
ncbi:MAG: hypothetical protein IT287_09845 [Bdellovibrionaceae bacterium]|nr:hypothetical protein [Pseudobdellovibrionaceae bacterium]